MDGVRGLRAREQGPAVPTDAASAERSGPSGSPGSPGPVLVARDLTKRYGRRRPPVLRGIYLTMVAGDHVVLLGGNGSGKSTLLRLAVGLSRPTGGVISVRSIRPGPTGPTGPSKDGRALVAYVPERLPASMRMTAAQYLGHLGRIRGLTPEAAGERAAELMGRLRLDPGPHVPMAVLSKGNRQKVALGQAFLVPVDLVALDEPTSGLDDDATAALEGLVASVCAAGGAVLSAGHHVGHWPTTTAAYELTAGVLRAEAPRRSPVNGPAQAAVAPTTPEAAVTDRPAGGVVRLRLRLPPGSDPTDRGSGLPAPAEAGTARAAAADVALVVERAAVDGLLARALARRFSVLEVRPEAAEP
jgi:ATPase subunit of ABC transporter with duplicated ATPase domains